MATQLLTIEERITQLTSNIAQIRGGIVALKALKKKREDWLTRDDPDVILVRMAANLTDIQSMVGEAENDIDAIDWTWSTMVVANEEQGYDSFDVDVDDGAGGATITASGGNPFGDFAVGDQIRVELAEDADHNGSYTLSAAAVAVLTIDKTIDGSDNTKDTTMRITKIYDA
jgi:hypothetical protein